LFGTSSLSDNAIRWRPKHEYIILGSNGDPRAENSNRHDGSVLEFTRPSNDDRFHPTEKPEDLMRYLVESLTEEGDVVLDPFAGSGVTLDAARQTGRKYIGIEIDEEFHEKIQERLSQMTLV
jgi:DNA modification methylase